VAAAALVFAGLLLVLARRARAGSRAGVIARPDPLEALVRLDAAYADREGQVPAAEWNEYLRRRAQGSGRSRPCDPSSPLLALRQYN
jgi:hypothetical protein